MTAKSSKNYGRQSVLVMYIWIKDGLEFDFIQLYILDVPHFPHVFKQKSTTNLWLEGYSVSPFHFSMACLSVIFAVSQGGLPSPIAPGVHFPYSLFFAQNSML